MLDTKFLWTRAPYAYSRLSLPSLAVPPTGKYGLRSSSYDNDNEDIFGLSNDHYPQGWDKGRHPDDLKVLSEPIKPEYLEVVEERSETDRTLFRISFKLSRGFVPASFIVDTGAPSGIYVTEE